MNEIKRVKRNENLVVLSHEHHHGLIFCSRLKKAKQPDDEILKRYVTDFWVNHLVAHFVSEEKLLLPLMWDNEITAQFLSDHIQIEELIQSIMGNNKNVKEEALNLAKLINDHIRFEERIMFPWLQEVLSPIELVTVGKELKGTEIIAHQFLPEFWKNEN